MITRDKSVHVCSRGSELLANSADTGEETNAYANHIGTLELPISCGAVLHAYISGNVVLNLSTQKCVRDRIANEHLPEMLSLLSSSIPFARRYLVLCILFNLSLDDGKQRFCITALCCWEFYPSVKTLIVPPVDKLSVRRKMCVGIGVRIRM